MERKRNVLTGHKTTRNTSVWKKRTKKKRYQKASKRAEDENKTIFRKSKEYTNQIRKNSVLNVLIWNETLNHDIKIVIK